MLLSLSWLREFVPYEGTAQELGDRLTMLGLELEEIVRPYDAIASIVVGHVVECVDHPESDHLHICKVDAGQGELLDIVCGAPNVAAGQKVPVALVGTTMPDGFSLVKRLCHTGRIFFYRLLRLLKTPHKVFGILGRSRIRERIAGDEGRSWLGGISAQVVPAPGRCLPVPHGFVDASFRGVPFRSTEGAKVSRCLLVRSRSLFDLLATVITAGEQVQPLLSASHERRLPERGWRHLPQRLQDARSLIAQAQIGLDGSLSHLGGSFSRHLLAIQAGHTFCGVTYAT